MDKIFIQIASYRDSQLIPTIKDILNTAEHPENLTFGICWQHDETENLNEFINDPRFKIIDVDYKDSKGCCWARNKTQQLYNGEKYTMQIDSHMRFVQNWDSLCIEMIEDLFSRGYKKPMLTGYPPSFIADRDPESRMSWPIKVIFKKFYDQGVVDLDPVKLDGWENLTFPVMAKYFSAGFAFTIGDFCKEVPYDPNFFFRGEEISMSIRLYTSGYDFFHPHRIILWHEYTRSSAPKNNNTELFYKGKHRAEVFVGIKKDNTIDFGIYGLGSERTFQDYEKFTGITFSPLDASKCIEMEKMK